MKKFILKDINFRYINKVIFRDFNIEFNKGLSFIIGNNGGGKSTLFSILNFRLPHNGLIYIDDIIIEKKDNRILLLDNTYINNLKGPVKDLFLLYEETEVLKLLKTFELEKYLNSNFENLNYITKIKITFINIFLTNSEVILIDDILCWLNKIDKQTILKKLKTISKKKAVIISTKNLEDTITADRIILLDSGKVMLDDNVKNFYKNEKTLNLYNIKPPFLIDLSLNLMLYNTVDDIYTDMRKLVDNIWK